MDASKARQGRNIRSKRHEKKEKQLLISSSLSLLLPLMRIEVKGSGEGEALWEMIFCCAIAFVLTVVFWPVWTEVRVMSAACGFAVASLMKHTLTKSGGSAREGDDAVGSATPWALAAGKLLAAQLMTKKAAASAMMTGSPTRRRCAGAGSIVIGCVACLVVDDREVERNNGQS